MDFYEKVAVMLIDTLKPDPHVTRELLASQLRETYPTEDDLRVMITAMWMRATQDFGNPNKPLKLRPGEPAAEVLMALKEAGKVH